MFQRITSIDEQGATVAIRFEGREIAVPEGQTVAAALLMAGVTFFREAPVSGSPRGPYCLMGACFECLVTIDGLQGRQACMTLVQQGMVIRRDRLRDMAP